MTIIRLENPEDAAEIEALLRACFPTPAHGASVWTLTASIREREDVERGLALVAEVGLSIAGYALLSRAELGEAQAAVLTPLAVLPQYRRQGVGALLVERGLEIAQSKGYACALAPAMPYFARFGFRPLPDTVQAPGLPEQPPLLRDLREEAAAARPLCGALRFSSAFSETDGCPEP